MGGICFTWRVYQRLSLDPLTRTTEIFTRTLHWKVTSYSVTVLQPVHPVFTIPHNGSSMCIKSSWTPDLSISVCIFLFPRIWYLKRYLKLLASNSTSTHDNTRLRDFVSCICIDHFTFMSYNLATEFQNKLFSKSR